MRYITRSVEAFGLLFAVGLVIATAVSQASAQAPPPEARNFYFLADFEDGTFDNTGDSGGTWQTAGSGNPPTNGTAEILDDSSSGSGQSKILRMTKSVGDFFGAWQPGAMAGPNYVIDTLFRVNQGDGVPALGDSPQIFRAPHVGGNGEVRRLSNDFWAKDVEGQLKIQSWVGSVTSMDIEYNTWYRLQGQRDVNQNNLAQGIMKYWIDGDFWMQTTSDVPDPGEDGEYGPSNSIGDLGFRNRSETGSIDWDYLAIYNPVPEPGTLGLLALAGLLIVGRSRRLVGTRR